MGATGCPVAGSIAWGAAVPGVAVASLATPPVSAFAANWNPVTMPTRAKKDVAPVTVRARAAGWMRLVIVFTLFVIVALVGAVVVFVVIVIVVFASSGT